MSAKREQYPPGTIQYTANYQVGGPVYSPPAAQGPPSAKYAQFAGGGGLPSPASSSAAYPPPSSAGSQYPYSPTTSTSYHSSVPYAPDSPVHSPAAVGSRRDDYYRDDYERAYRDAERQRDDDEAHVREIERRERESEREYERKKERDREMERERAREREMDRDRIHELERRERQSRIDWERQRETDRLNEIERRGQSSHLDVSRDPRERVPSRTRERSRSKERGGLKLSVETGSSKTRLSVTKSKKEEKRKKKEQREAALAWSSGDSGKESDSGSASSGRRSDDSRRRRHHRHREHRYSHTSSSPRQSTGSFHGGHSPRHSTSSFHSSHLSESGGRYLVDDGYRRNPREHRPSMNAVTTKFDRMELMSPSSGRHSPPSPGGYRDRDQYYADLSPLPSPVMGPADSSRSFGFNVSGGFSIGRPAYGGDNDGPSGKWPSLTSGAPNFLKPSILKKSIEERYDPSDDAKALYKGLKGRSGDPTPIIKILPKLSGPQIIKLKSEYKRVHAEGYSLTKSIKAQLPGNFKLTAWMTAAGPWESEGYWAIFSNHKPSYRYQLLIEALIGRTNDDIIAIKEAYRDSKNDNSIEKAIKKELAADKNTGERFKSMVLQQLQAKRMEEWDTVYYDKVSRDVEHLHVALSRTPKPDTQAVVDIIIQRNNTHLREAMKLYKNVHDKDLARTIITKIPNLVGEALVHLLNGVLNKPARDAKLLEASMRGLGTADILLQARLIRIHWDPEHLTRVKEAYAQKFKRDLIGRIQGDTSGDYQTFLVALAISDEKKTRKS